MDVSAVLMGTMINPQNFLWENGINHQPFYGDVT